MLTFSRIWTKKLAELRGEVAAELDLDQKLADLRGEVAAELDLDNKLVQLHGDFTAELKLKVTELRDEMTGELVQVRQELKKL